MPTNSPVICVNVTPKILIVDDRPENLLALCATLEDLDIEIIEATSGQAALAALLNHEIALVLLDVQMPEMDGYEVASIMKASISTANIPIIFLTAISKDEHYVQKGYQSGAVDYIAKPLNPEILLSKVRVFLQLWTQSNELKQLTDKYKDLLDEVTKQRDILNELSTKDHLTGVYQRRAFDEFLDKEYAKSIRYERPLSIAMLDLDYFKAVNDTYGHFVGDEVLISAAKTIESVVRESDVVCRFGGEEFIVLMPDTDLENANMCCERILQGIENLVFSAQKQTFSITISIGIAAFVTAREMPIEKLIKHADECLYQAKNNGRNQIYSTTLS